MRHDEEIYGAVTGNCGIKVCFQVGGDDARKMAEEFGGFAPADLMNLPVCSALARIGPRDHSFNLETRFVPPSERPLNEAYAEALAETRKRYCTPRSSIREELAELRKTIPTGKGEDPFSKLSRQQKQEREDRQKRLGEEPPVESHAGEARPDEPTAAKTAADGKRIKIITRDSADEETVSAPEADTKAEGIKNAIIQAAGGWGFSHETEMPVNEGTGRVDLVLTLGSLVIACEISATTPADHEFETNIKKCLRAGFERIFHICDTTRRRERIMEMIQQMCAPEERQRIECVSTHRFLTRLAELAEQHRAKSNPAEASSGKTVLGETQSVTDAERKQALDNIWSRIAQNKQRDRKPPESGAE